MAATDLRARREAVLGPGAPLFYDNAVHIVRGSGVYLWDADGKRYLDMYNNVPCVGHCHPHVVEAMHVQSSTLNVHSRYLHDGIVRYAERLAAIHDASLDRIVFACTGTEANEIAIAAARARTGGRGIICTDRAYHGNTEEMMRYTWAGLREHPEVRPIKFPERYRPIKPGASDEELCELHLLDLRRAIESFQSAGVKLAGMLICSIYANEGLPDVPAGYLPRAVQMLRQAGGLLIADEVQAGLGRTGKYWGYETMGFVPDIATMLPIT